MDQWVREQYKSKGGFGMKTLETRRNATVVNRKEQRNTLLKKFRNIPETMSPLNTPVASKTKQLKEEKETVSKPKGANTEGKNKRLMMLKKWKEEKERKKLEEKKKAKPAFKVFHVEHKENLEDVYKSIKGKPINSKSKNATPLVPNKTSENASKTLRTLNSRVGKPENNKISNNQRNAVTRSKTTISTKVGEKLSGRGQTKTERQLVTHKSESIVKSDINNKGKKVQNSTATLEQNKLKSPAKNILNEGTVEKNERKSRRKSKRKNEEEINKDSNASEENKQVSSEDEVFRVSPFVTVARGKAAARKEMEEKEQKTPRRSRRSAIKLNLEMEESTPSKTSSKKSRRDKTPLPSSSLSSESSLESSPNKKGESLGDSFLEISKKPTSDEICYVSPFVTMSRGKAAARKEFEQRKSLNGSIFNTSMSGAPDPRSPKAAADYFTKVLNNEIARIQDLCKIWQNYKDEANISEDACGLIDMTIGQSNLLITKKFNQFRGLIERCKSDDELDQKVQCEDLHGFWDMIYKQVTDLEKRFNNLEDMRKNNWLEEAPKAKTPKVAVKTKRKGRAKGTKASSGLKETILAARKFRMNQKQSESDDVDILIVGKKETPRRLSKNVKEISTPGKGILKSVNVKSEKRKTVVFHNLIEKDDKNTSPRVFRGTPVPSRRSERISLNRSKLKFEE